MTCPIYRDMNNMPPGRTASATRQSYKTRSTFAIL